MNENDPTKVLLDTLDREIRWQWSWETLNRLLYLGVIMLSWLSNIGVLVLVFYQLQLGDDFQRWILLAIAVLSMLSVSLTAFSNQFAFRQRQEVFDALARKYFLLRKELEMGTITPEEAFRVFKQMHEKPIEKIVRETA